MRTLTVEQQLAMLRRVIRSPIGRHMTAVLGSLAACLALLGYAIGHPIPWIFAAFFGLVAVFERQAVPNISAALKAYDACEPVAGWAVVTVVRGDETDSYRAIVELPGRARWQFQFMPQGWTPAAGRFPARVWMPAGSDAPVMAALDAGVLIPRYCPEVLVPADRSAGA